jgi:hypothetical protein
MLYSIKEVCGRALHCLLGAHGTRRVAILSAWYESAGSYASYVEPLGVEGETLVLAVSSQVVACELNYRHEELVRLVNARLGDGAIKDVRIVVRLPQGGGPLGARSAGRCRKDEG